VCVRLCVCARVHMRWCGFSLKPLAGMCTLRIRVLSSSDYMSIYTYIYIYIYIHIYIFMYICMHT